MNLAPMFLLNLSSKIIAPSPKGLWKVSSMRKKCWPLGLSNYVHKSKIHTPILLKPFWLFCQQQKTFKFAEFLTESKSKNQDWPKLCTTRSISWTTTKQIVGIIFVSAIKQIENLNTHRDIAIFRLKWPRGQFSKNTTSAQNTLLSKKYGIITLMYRII